MTRRIRFTPFLRAGVFAGAMGLAGFAHAAEVPFAAPLPVFTLAGPVSHWAPADIDGDADVDLLVAAPAEGRLLLLRNMDGAGTTWSAVTVATAAPDPRDVVAGDIDRDGDLDAASVSHPSGLLAWHENLTGNGMAWTTHTIATDAATVVEVGDIDRDGNLDIIAMASGTPSGPLRWFRNGGGGASWTPQGIGFGTALERTLDVVDIDGDGDPDVLTTAFGSDTWWENPNPPNTLWTFHTAGYGGATGIAVGDMDRDGDPDVISQFSWYENTTSGIGSQHVFAPGGFGAQMPTPADVDGDGDLDFWANDIGESIVWWDNVTGDGDQLVRRLLTSGRDPFGATPVDLDGDGDLDALSASGASPTSIVRHMNETIHRSACFGPAVTVSTASDTLDDLITADLDLDGDLDLVTADLSDSALRWHESTAAGASWTPHTLSTATSFPSSLATADVDRDGDPDVVAGDNPGAQKRALWLENTSPGPAFPLHIIGTGISPYLSQIAAGDIDGDGDVDAFQATSEFVARWYANASGNGATWAPGVTIGGTSGELVDIDGDGDLDVASAYADFSGMHNVGWRENVDGTGASWSMHTITTDVSWPFVITAGDLDGDGDVDFAHGGLDSNALRWRINGGGGSSWTLQTVGGAGLGARLADLDRDGDMDLPWSGGPGNTFGWHENRNGVGSEWLGHALPLSGSPSASGHIEAADIDRDGDVDLVADPGSLVWYPNQGGQYALAAENQAPATIQQGNTVSMLRVTVTHLGRAGDGPLELSRFGLLLEEAAGDPLTTAEANLLADNLSVYRDANGNGVFDPAADVPVAGVGTLALTDGVQLVPFADGDPNVAVAFGTPRTYFVLVGLTPDASTQDPNRLRVTLLQLGPSASQAEHAAYDIPLTSACPVDTPSEVVVATIPVELMGFTIE